MRPRLLFAPWWVHSLIWGGYTAVFRTIFNRIPPATLPGGPVDVGISILLGSVLFGAVMGPFMARANEPWPRPG